MNKRDLSLTLLNCSIVNNSNCYLNQGRTPFPPSNPPTDAPKHTHTHTRPHTHTNNIHICLSVSLCLPTTHTRTHTHTHTPTPTHHPPRTRPTHTHTHTVHPRRILCTRICVCTCVYAGAYESKRNFTRKGICNEKRERFNGRERGRREG